MTTTPLQSELCRYHYDALDRSITWTPVRQAGFQRFFCKDRLVTEIQNAAQRSIFQHDDQVLAQQNRWSNKVDTTLLTTDRQRSVLNAVDSTQAHRIAYPPYGHRPIGNGLLSLLGFNGERPDPVTGHYHLGHGYRQYNPVLMRFNCPDRLSPFGKGGVNAYAYCGNDPLNWTDPSGMARFKFWKTRISPEKKSEFDKIAKSLMHETQEFTYRSKDGIHYKADSLKIIENRSDSDLKEIKRAFKLEYKEFLKEYRITIDKLDKLPIPSTGKSPNIDNGINGFDRYKKTFKKGPPKLSSPKQKIEWLYLKAADTRDSKVWADNLLKEASGIRNT